MQAKKLLRVVRFSGTPYRLVPSQKALVLPVEYHADGALAVASVAF